jgi:outer membrane immunogenic protein
MTNRGYLLATASGIAAVAAAGGAQAADMPMPVKAPVLVPPPVSWAGFYIGGNIGAAWQSMHADNRTYASDGSPNDTSGNSFIGGGQVGYNWQSGAAVFGIEGDFSGLSSTSSNITTSKGGVSTKMNWLSTVRGRLGLAAGNTMVYVTGGVAWASINNTTNAGVPGDTPNIKSFSNVHTGWVIGGGVEQMLAPHWTVGLEALWVNFGQTSSTATFPQRQKGSTFQNQAVIGRLKVNYKF